MPNLRRLILPFLIVLTTIAFLPFYLLFQTWLSDHDSIRPIPPGLVNDASRLNETPVLEYVPIPDDRTEAEDLLRQLLIRAHRDNLKISISGARHSMGGHTIARDGIRIDMLPYKRMKLNKEQKLLSVGSGARWSEIIPYLDSLGYSVAVMQSNNDFSVGGSVSVNAHGWQHNQPPIASTVESFRIMTADGKILHCSRKENPELFSLALGGYGLFGILLEVDLRVVPNENYHPEAYIVPADSYVSKFSEVVDRSDDIGMVYGRICVVPGEDFLQEAILTVFRRSSHARENNALQPTGMSTLRREIFRAQTGSVLGKRLRWWLEKNLGEQIAQESYSRNQLLNESAEVYQERSGDRTDILHEYFIPEARFNEFLEKARTVISSSGVDLLNVTVRNLYEDRDSYLPYADRKMFALVMLFNQSKDETSESKMTALTKDLITAALECGGRYYLPYRLHATQAQFEAAYPMAKEFFKRKLKYDPNRVFQNQFYQKYGAGFN